jgi:hypothetical protein
MLNISEGDFSGEQGIEDPQELIGSGDDGFFMLHPLFLFPFVVAAKHLGIKDDTQGHLVDGAAQMSVASFRDSVLTFEFSGFLNDWVNSAGGNGFFMRSQGTNGGNFSDEVGGAQIADALDRGKNSHWFWITGIYFSNELWFDGGQFFCQLEQSFDTAFQDFFSVIVVNADGMMSNVHNFISGKVYFSTFTGGDFFDDFGDFFLTQFSGEACRRNLKQELKHGFGEDVIFSAQFVKDIEGDLFNSIFEFGDFSGDYFVFPAEEFGGISGRVVFDFVRIFEQETGDGFCRDFVGGGFSQSAAFFEVFDQQGIKERNVVALGAKKVEDIEMIAAGGFDADGDIFWVTDNLQAAQEFVKFFFGLEESSFRNDFFRCVKGTEVQGIKGCIYAEKIFIFRHGLASFFALNGLKSGNSKLSLPSSIVIRDLCPNQLIRNGESGGRTPLRALGPGLNSSPCFQSAKFCGGLSSISSLIISKLYSNST